MTKSKLRKMFKQISDIAYKIDEDVFDGLEKEDIGHMLAEIEYSFEIGGIKIDRIINSIERIVDDVIL